MRKLDTKEASSRSMVHDAEANTVTVVHTVKPDEKHQTRYELTWTFDFANVTAMELIMLATRPLLIKAQGLWRKADDRLKEAAWDNRTFKVRDALDNARVAANPVTKAANAGKKMNKDERAALIAQLQAQQDESDDE